MNIETYKIKNAAVILLLLISGSLAAQQEPMFTQYNFNTQVINPAYAGTWENTGFMLLGRQQWIGMGGAPQTYTLSVQTKTGNDKVGLGINVMSDNVGREKRLGLFGDYSYGFQVNEKSVLQLGLKFGVTSYQNNLTQYLQYPGEADPSLQLDSDVRYLPNFGVGAYWYADNYFLGFSVPKIMENEFETNYNNYSTQAELRHFYLIGGYVFNLSDVVKFKPTFLAKTIVGVQPEFDFSANFLLAEKVWLGGTYRTGNSFGFVAQWIIENLRIGYGVDFSTTKLQAFNYGSHEVMVSYEISFKKKYSSPRMF